MFVPGSVNPYALMEKKRFEVPVDQSTWPEDSTFTISNRVDSSEQNSIISHARLLQPQQQKPLFPFLAVGLLMYECNQFCAM